MNIRRHRKRMHAMTEISLTPLIDTALVLLVIFMIATPIMQNSINIDLPKGHVKEESASSTNSLILAINAQEQLYLNDVRYSLEELLEELVKRVERTKENKVYVHCDQKVPSGSLVKIIDSVKYVAGVEHVVLSTERAR